MRSRSSMSQLVALGLLVIVTACAVPQRVPLPAPVPLTAGGTPVPGKGVGAALAISDGLQGQELLRKELLSFMIAGGFADVVNLTVGIYGGSDTDDAPDVTVVAGKARLGSFLGPRTSTAVHVSRSQVERMESGGSSGTVQNERLVTWDIAIPTEYLLTDLAASTRFSVYAGPRLLREDYDDRLVPSDSFNDWIPGVLGGLHLAFGRVHLFGEGTVAFRPETTFRGATFDGGPIFLPTGALAAHFGSPFRWDRSKR